MASNNSDNSNENPDHYIIKAHGLTIELKKGAFKRQKRFALDDSLYHIKIIDQDTPNLEPGGLITALQEAFIKILNLLKKRYGHEERRQAYISIYGGLL